MENGSSLGVIIKKFEALWLFFKAHKSAGLPWLHVLARAHMGFVVPTSTVVASNVISSIIVLSWSTSRPQRHSVSCCSWASASLILVALAPLRTRYGGASISPGSSRSLGPSVNFPSQKILCLSLCLGTSGKS